MSVLDAVCSNMHSVPGRKFTFLGGTSKLLYYKRKYYTKKYSSVFLYVTLNLLTSFPQ